MISIVLQNLIPIYDTYVNNLTLPLTKHLINETINKAWYDRPLQNPTFRPSFPFI